MVAAAVVVAGSCAPATAPAAGELALTVSGTPAQLIVGDVLTLTTKVTNESGGVADDVWTHYTPNGEDPFKPPTVTAVSPGFCIPFGPSLNCQLGSLANGALFEHVVNVSLPAGGYVRVDVGADAEGGLSASQQMWEATIEAKADTKIDLTATPTQPRPNDQVTVRALVTNTTAEGTAYGTSVRFSIPAGIDVIDKPADCTGTALNITCPVGDLPPQTSRDKIITVRSATEGSFAILSSVTWARPDTTPIDTQAQVSVTVAMPPEDPAPTPPKPTGPPKPITAKPGTIAQGLPLSGRCVRSRRITFVLRSIRAFDPVRAKFRITGRKRALIVKGRRALEPITIGLPRRRGRVLLRLEVTYDSGRTYRASRAFRRC